MAEMASKEEQGAPNLMDLFHEGEQHIQRKRTENIFKQLDERQLTEDEQNIIQQRIALQRKMLQEYEKRDRARKVREVQEVCPKLTEEAAIKALELCNWKEDEAAVRLASDTAFARRVIGNIPHEPVQAAPKAEKPQRASRAREANNGVKAAPGPRPTVIDPSTIKQGVFVGRFKGRLGPHQLSAVGQQQAAGGGVGAAMASGAPAPALAAQGLYPNGRAAGVSVASGTDQATDRHAAEELDDEEKLLASVPRRARSQRPMRAGSSSPGTAAAAMLHALAEELHPQADGEGSKEEPGVPREDADGVAAQEDGAGGKEPCMEAEDADGAAAMEEDGVMTDHDNCGDLDGIGSGDVDEEGSDEELNSADVSDGELQYEHELPIMSSPLMSPHVRQQLRAGREELQVCDQQAPPKRTPLNARLEAAAQEQGVPAGAPFNVQHTEGDAQPSQVADPALHKEPASHKEPPQQQQEPAAGARTICQPMDLDAGPVSQSAGCSQPDEPDQLEPASARAARQRSQQVASSSPCRADAAQDAGGPGSPSAARRSARVRMPTKTIIEATDDEGTDSDTSGYGAKRRPAGTKAAAAKRRRVVVRSPITDSQDDFEEQHPAAKRGKARRGTVPHAPVEHQAPKAAAFAESGAAAAKAPQPDRQHSGPAPDAGDQAQGAHAATGNAAGLSGQASQPSDSADPEATASEDEGAEAKGGSRAPVSRAHVVRGSGAGGGGVAISATGHTCRGRVKQKGVKRAELFSVGKLVARPGWYNAGYIFPAGFKTQTNFRSSVQLEQLTIHTCEILGEDGEYWPAPTFVVLAADRPDEPLVAKSCTGCWTAVLKRINSEIEARRAAGEDLPPPPKTAIAGPEYFGLNQPEICRAIEELDEDHACTEYWLGKSDRLAAQEGQPVSARERPAAAPKVEKVKVPKSTQPKPPPVPKAPRAPAGAGGAGGRGRRGRRNSNEMDEDAEEAYAGNRWSAVSRTERYRKRCEDAGEDVSVMDADNPLPGFIDPITLEPVVNPAISPYGHVMGLATWRAVLADQGRCPFTKQALKAEQVTVLTKSNIERLRGRIANL